MGRALDDTDRRLLRALVENARQTTRALAKLVGLSDPSTHDRVNRLENDGVITGYHAMIDPSAVDAGTAAFVAMHFGSGKVVKEQVDDALRAEPCVIEAHEVAGEDCYYLKIRVSSPRALADALNRIREIPTVDRTRTTVVLRTVFERVLSPE